ncbi:hypothetical protein EVAR_27812_1 [Eumeta japonica]|uniref:Uncharacterized protein n=1 Tax=Eumeta variegata TaxID=151549 RepID=A0A4C1VI51_EUMVA|nr:hypothetical protein EVAR_27812_1 [Eumeta japonica]
MYLFINTSVNSRTNWQLLVRRDSARPRRNHRGGLAMICPDFVQIETPTGNEIENANGTMSGIKGSVLSGGAGKGGVDIENGTDTINWLWDQN